MPIARLILTSPCLNPGDPVYITSTGAITGTPIATEAPIGRVISTCMDSDGSISADINIEDRYTYTPTTGMGRLVATDGTRFEISVRQVTDRVRADIVGSWHIPEWYFSDTLSKYEEIPDPIDYVRIAVGD